MVVLENDALRIEVLAGKGSDVTEVRDKRTDVNVLFEAPHRWRAPTEGYVGAPDGTASFLDHYPGGWQTVLPAAGGPTENRGATLALHGESALTPWKVTTVEESPERVSVTLSTSLTRYPFEIERHLSITDGSSALVVDENVTNQGELPVEYSWLQHIALGQPLVSPAATLNVDCETVLVDPDQSPNARLPAGVEFDWPSYESEDTTIDLRNFPPKSARVHDLVALTDFDSGEYRVSNPELDLQATVRFPADHYEYLWYWQPFGGFETAPFFGRNYNVGLEPATSIPNSGLSDAIENNTANTLDAGEQVSASVELETGPLTES